MNSKNYYDYTVYDDGRIWSNHKMKWLKHAIDKRGYHSITLFIDGEREVWKVHRLVATLFLDNPNHLPQINHIDGDKNNNSIDNLEWCDAKYNNWHARFLGLNNISKSNKKRFSSQEARENISNKLKQKHLEDNWSAGKRNGKWRYLIYFKNQEIERKDLPSVLGLAQSTCDALIAKIAKGKTSRKDLLVIDMKGQSTIGRV